MILIKNFTSFFLKVNYGIDQDFKFENILIEKPNVIRVIKNEQFPKIHGLFYQIISGEKIVNNNEFHFNYKVINYFSLKKRFDLEQSVYENFLKFYLEDSIIENNILRNFNNLKNFLDFEIDTEKPVERYSTGQISKIIYSIPFFLNYDVYILSPISRDIDLDFNDKLMSKLTELYNSKIIFMDFIYDNQPSEIFTNYLDFRELENINLTKLENLNKESGQGFVDNNEQLFIKTGDQVINDNNLNKYIDHFNAEFLQVDKNYRILKNLESFHIKLSISSKLPDDFTFKFGLNVRLKNKTIISQTSSKWLKTDQKKEINLKINIPNVFVDDIYDFFLSIKVENLNERNEGKAFRIMENFLISRLIYNDHNTLKSGSLIKPEYIFDKN